jgi:hypothetical protein
MQFIAMHDGSNDFFMQGATSALDDNLDDDKSYVYRLDKKRGGIVYEGNEVTVFSLTRPMPYGEVPVADGFRSDGNIKLQWSFDEGADAYVLMRRSDSSSGFYNWETAYQGPNNQYLDESVDDIRSARYEYRLDKLRNGLLYKSDETVFAVAVHAEEDKHEPNNILEEATELETYLESNLYYYKYSNDNDFIGTDWYKVYVHPGKTASIKVQYSTGVYDEWLLFSEPSERSIPITSNFSFEIKNDSTEKRYMYFEIEPNKGKFLDGLNVGGSIINYTIELVSITDN